MPLLIVLAALIPDIQRAHERNNDNVALHRRAQSCLNCQAKLRHNYGNECEQGQLLSLDMCHVQYSSLFVGQNSRHLHYDAVAHRAC